MRSEVVAELEVEHHHIGRQAPGQGDPLLASGGITYELEVRLARQQLAHAVDHHRMVVDHQNG